MDGQASPELSHPLSVILVALGFLTVFVTAIPASEWKGTREVRDGVTYVWNPAEPMEGTVEYELREVWRLESERPDGSLLFGVPADATEDADGNVLVLDSRLACVHRVGPSGEYLGRIGREGDGPGEFRHPTEVFVAQDGNIGVVDLQAGKVILINPLGEPHGSWSINLAGYKRAWVVSVLPCAASYAVQLGYEEFTETEVRTTYAVQLFSPEGTPGRRLLETTQSLDRNHPYDFVQEPSEAVCLHDASRNGRTLVSPSYRDYVVRIYDQNGMLLSEIEREYEALARTDAEYEAEQAYWEGLYRAYKGVRVQASHFHRTIAAAGFQDDGTTWVTSSRGWREVGPGIVGKADVFDAQGRFLQQAVLTHEISHELDVVIPLGDRWIIVKNGVGAEMAAVGAADLAEGPGEESGPPVIICCRAVMNLDSPSVRDTAR